MTTVDSFDLAADDLACYGRLMWRGFSLAPHHELIINKLEAIERGEIRRLMIVMPPRHGKSLIGSQIFPAWYLGRNPERSIILASYEQEIADTFGRKVRDLVCDPLHQATFPRCEVTRG